MHYGSFDEVSYDLQTAGEYVLARSIAGDSFEVQARQVKAGAAASVFSAAAINLGEHRASFAIGRDQVVYVDGVAQAMTDGQRVTFSDGSYVERGSDTHYSARAASGDLLGIVLPDPFSVFGFQVNLELVKSRTPGSVVGLLGNADGSAANDFIGRDGIDYGATPANDDLYLRWSESWRITQAESLFDYAPGETTETYTFRGFPDLKLLPSSFPAEAQAAAAAAVDAAGIVNPQLRAETIADYLLTGDPAFIRAARALEVAGLATIPVAVVPPAASGTPVTLVGISAANATLRETTGGATAVGFQVYRTGDTSAPLTLSYGFAQAGGATSFTAADFGGAAPSGSVTIAAGESGATFSVAAPGFEAGIDKLLRIALSPTAGGVLVPDSATVRILNDTPVAGTAAAAGLSLLAGGYLSGSGQAYTLDLGPVSVGAGATARLQVGNLAASGGNTLAASVDAASGDATLSSPALTVADIMAGSYAGGLAVTVSNAGSGVHVATIVLHPTQSNETGFAGALSDVTLTVTYTGLAPSAPPSDPALFGTTITDASGTGGHVYEIYAGLLDRAPDALGFAFWLDAVRHGATFGDVAAGLLRSSEYEAAHGPVSAETDAGYVAELYATVLGRAADAPGQAFWTDALAHGVSRADAAVSFAVGPENQAQDAAVLSRGVFVPDPSAGDVARLYYAILDRAPDASGLTFWSEAVRGGAPAANVARDFLDASEAAGRFAGATDTVFLDHLYEGALGRAADPGGQAFWQDALAHGASRAAVAAGIAESQEAKVHHLAEIEQGWHLSA